MRQVVNIFACAREMHEFAGIRQRRVRRNRVLQEILNRFNIMVRGSLNRLHLRGALGGKCSEYGLEMSDRRVAEWFNLWYT